MRYDERIESCNLVILTKHMFTCLKCQTLILNWIISGNQKSIKGDKSSFIWGNPAALYWFTLRKSTYLNANQILLVVETFFFHFLYWMSKMSELQIHYKYRRFCSIENQVALVESQRFVQSMFFFFFLRKPSDIRADSPVCSWVSVLLSWRVLSVQVQ